MDVLYETKTGEFIVEVIADDLIKIKGDDDYIPEPGDTIDITAQWDAWLWIAGKKAAILAAGNQLTTLANKIPD